MERFIGWFLTPDACALVGDVVLQFGPEARLSSSAPHTPIVHEQERLVVVVQAARVPGRVLDVVLSRKAALNYVHELIQQQKEKPEKDVDTLMADTK